MPRTEDLRAIAIEHAARHLARLRQPCEEGHVATQSDDQSSEITRIFAGPLGCAISHSMAAVCWSLRRTLA